MGTDITGVGGVTSNVLKHMQITMIDNGWLNLKTANSLNVPKRNKTQKI